MQMMSLTVITLHVAPRIVGIVDIVAISSTLISLVDPMRILNRFEATLAISPLGKSVWRRLTNGSNRASGSQYRCAFANLIRRLNGKRFLCTSFALRPTSV